LKAQVLQVGELLLIWTASQAEAKGLTLASTAIFEMMNGNQ
jgi:hypothetical protein